MYKKPAASMKKLTESEKVEYEHRKRYILPNSKIFAFFTGIVLGTVYFYFFRTKLLQNNIILNFETIKQIQDLKVDYSEVFIYVYKDRITQLVILLLCSCSYFAVPLLYGVICYIGFNICIFFYISVYAYGFKGIIFSVISFFPQSLFYLICICGLCQFVRNDNTKYYHKCKTFFLLIVFYVIGILTESFLNPYLIHRMALLF